MPKKNSRRTAVHLGRLAELREALQTRQAAAAGLAHTHDPARRQTTLLPICLADCPACAAIRENDKLGKQIRKVQIPLLEELESRAIASTRKSAKGGEDAARKRAQSLDEVIGPVIKERLRLGKELRWDHIQSDLKKKAETMFRDRKWPPPVLMHKSAEHEITKAFNQAPVGKPVRVGRNWIRLPSESSIRRRLKEVCHT